MSARVVMSEHYRPRHGFFEDNELIHLELLAACAEEREISDATARVIAAQHCGGQASELYRFTSTGRISTAFFAELDATIAETADEQDREHLVALGRYALEREDAGPQEGWFDLWLQQPPESGWNENDRCSACGEHIADPHALDCPLNDDDFFA